MTKKTKLPPPQKIGPEATDFWVDTVAGRVTFGPKTLVVALDETGHESFADPNYSLYGLGGCAFLVRDFARLIYIPWEFMCETYFGGVERPLHAVDLRQPTSDQIFALTHYFSRFQIFRLAVTVHKNAYKADGSDIIDIVGRCMIDRILEIMKYVNFDRIAVIVEDSQRIGVRILKSLHGYIMRDVDLMRLELFLLPKSYLLPALEVADFIIHTAGAQTRNRNERPDRGIRKDYDVMFCQIDERLVSTKEITAVAVK